IRNRHSCFAFAELRMISPRCELVSQAPPLAHLLAIAHTVYIGSHLSALRVGGICHLFSVAVILEARPGDSRTCICVSHHLLCHFPVLANLRAHPLRAQPRFPVGCILFSVGIPTFAFLLFAPRALLSLDLVTSGYDVLVTVSVYDGLPAIVIR